MNFRVTLGLLVALIVIGAGVYLSEGRSEAPAIPTPTGQRLLEFEANQATGLALVFAGKQVAFQKKADQWQISQPEQGEAIGPVVESVVGGLSQLTSNREIIAKSGDLASYGLDQPQGTITVTLNSGDTRRLLVGGANPDASAYYTRRPLGDGEVVVRVVPSQVVEQLKQLIDQPPKVLPTPTATSAAGTTAGQ